MQGAFVVYYINEDCPISHNNTVIALLSTTA